MSEFLREKAKETMNIAYGHMNDARYDVYEAEVALSHMDMDRADEKAKETVNEVLCAVKAAGKGISKGKDYFEDGKGKLDQVFEGFFELGFTKGMDAGKTFVKGVASYHIKQARREIEKGKRDTEKGHGKYTELNEKGKREGDIEKGQGKNTEINEKGKRERDTVKTFGDFVNYRLAKKGNDMKGGRFFPRTKKGRVEVSSISDMHEQYQICIDNL
jgi:hypothetical protein